VIRPPRERLHLTTRRLPADSILDPPARHNAHGTTRFIPIDRSRGKSRARELSRSSRCVHSRHFRSATACVLKATPDVERSGFCGTKQCFSFIFCLRRVIWSRRNEKLALGLIRYSFGGNHHAADHRSVNERETLNYSYSFRSVTRARDKTFF